MNRRLAELARRREMLRRTIEAQRAELAATGARWEAPLRLADSGIAAVRYVRAHPALLAAAAAVVVVLRPRAAWRLVGAVGVLLRQNPTVFSVASGLLSGLMRARRKE